DVDAEKAEDECGEKNEFYVSVHYLFIFTICKIINLADITCMFCYNYFLKFFSRSALKAGSITILVFAFCVAIISRSFSSVTASFSISADSASVICIGGKILSIAITRSRSAILV